MKTPITALCFLSLFATAGLCSRGLASTYNWAGSSGGSWYDGANWTTDSLSSAYPKTASDSATIGTGGLVVVQNTTIGSGNVGLACGSIILSKGSSLQLNGTKTEFIETTTSSISGNGTLLLNGGWLGGTALNISTNVIVSGTQSLVRAGHSNSVTFSGDVSGTGRLNTLSGYGTVVFSGSITPGSVGTVATFNISYNTDMGHTNACFKDFGADIMFNFDLGSTSNSDQLAISQNGKSYTIHDLDLTNFNFNYLDGFGVGTYVLINDYGSTDTIVGSLGSDVVRTVNGYTETLSISGNDIVLTVTDVQPAPEPASLLTLGIGITGVCLRKRGRRR